MRESKLLPVLIVVVGLALGSVAAFAQDEKAGQTFDFKDPKGVNNASFLLDSEVEPIMGIASGISGTVRFDPKNPSAISGAIEIDAKTVKTPNDRMNNKLHTDEWLAVEQHPTIRFETKKVKKVEKGKKEGEYSMLIVGTFTCRGKSKEIEIPVKVTYLEGKMQDRMRRPGDLLVLRSQFIIKRSDFDLGPEYPVVADEMQVRVAIVGGDPE